MKLISTIILCGVLVLAGCKEQPQSDQCLRAEIFKSCMASLPKGPESVHNSNDWDELVDSCEAVAFKQSRRPVSSIKPKCRKY